MYKYSISVLSPMILISRNYDIFNTTLTNECTMFRIYFVASCLIVNETYLRFVTQFLYIYESGK